MKKKIIKAIITSVLMFLLLYYFSASSVNEAVFIAVGTSVLTYIINEI
ncbi:hypothetical protein [Lacinutrix undariae]